jgi:hypothetical protein
MNTPSEGAGVKCHSCGSRPFAAAWGLPLSLECFDLIKANGKWGCPAHRVAKPKRADSTGGAEALLNELAEVIDNLDVEIIEDSLDEGSAQISEKGRERALKLVANIKLKLKPASP